MSGSDAPRERLALAPQTLTPTAIQSMIDEARDPRTGIARLVVAPAIAKPVVEALRGSGVALAGVVGYPLGLSKPTIKAIEATSLAKDGVDAVEVTPFPVHVTQQDWEALRAELLEIARGARAAKPTLMIDVCVDERWIDPSVIDALRQTILRAACDGLILQRGDVRQRV